MVAIIKGDIIGSRQITDVELWLSKLKAELSRYGQSPEHWEMAWGDAFQLMLPNPKQALHIAVSIKAAVKSILPAESTGTIGPLDVRMTIGIGDITHRAVRISECNGPAFVLAGDAFEQLKNEKVNMLFASDNKQLNEILNLCLRLSLVFMDNWSAAAAEQVLVCLHNPNATQTEIGQMLGIKQNSVSGRWKRANMDELLAVLAMYQHLYNQNFGE